jgi:hypothetical protein
VILHPLRPELQLTVSGAIITLIVYTVRWLSLDLYREKAIRKTFGFDSSVLFQDDPKESQFHLGYRAALILLAIAALCATWLVKEPCLILGHGRFEDPVSIRKTHHIA